MLVHWSIVQGWRAISTDENDLLSLYTLACMKMSKNLYWAVKSNPSTPMANMKAELEALVWYTESKAGLSLGTAVIFSRFTVDFIML